MAARTGDPVLTAAVNGGRQAAWAITQYLAGVSRSAQAICRTRGGSARAVLTAALDASRLCHASLLPAELKARGLRTLSDPSSVAGTIWRRRMRRHSRRCATRTGRSSMSQTWVAADMPAGRSAEASRLGSRRLNAAEPELRPVSLARSSSAAGSSLPSSSSSARGRVRLLGVVIRL